MTRIFHLIIFLTLSLATSQNTLQNSNAVSKSPTTDKDKTNENNLQLKDGQEDYYDDIEEDELKLDYIDNVNYSDVDISPIKTSQTPHLNRDKPLTVFISNFNYTYRTNTLENLFADSPESVHTVITNQTPDHTFQHINLNITNLNTLSWEFNTSELGALLEYSRVKIVRVVANIDMDIEEFVYYGPVLWNSSETGITEVKTVTNRSVFHHEAVVKLSPNTRLTVGIVKQKFDVKVPFVADVLVTFSNKEDRKTGKIVEGINWVGDKFGYDISGVLSLSGILSTKVVYSSDRVKPEVAAA